MKRQIFGTVLITFLVFNFALDCARAENMTQSFTLKPGWNAVFLEVVPQSKAPADVFSGISDLNSVWMWNPRTSTVQYIQNPDELVPEQPQWMAYFPNDPVLTNLFAIHGETPYLIHLGGSAEVTWTVTGQPAVPRIDWKANSFNFVGFHLDPGQEPLFQDFFSTSLPHKGQEIYLLDNATGTWVKVTDPTVQMRHGEAFWIYCKGHSEFVGPLSVQFAQGRGLEYGKTLVEQDLQILNNAATQKTIALTLSSAAVPLHYWLFDPDNNAAGWFAFPPDPLSIAAGEKQEIRLGVRRANLAAGTKNDSNLQITDGEGMRVILPVSVTGIDFAGLWVGNATIRKVSQPAATDKETPLKTGSEFSFRLILHVDKDDNARLLSEVTQLWQAGKWKPDPNALGKFIPDEPGKFVLVANDSKIADYSGSALRDGQPVGRRISTPAFGFSGPQDMIGKFELDQSLKLLDLTVLPGDPTNPFRHKYHPDHEYDPSNPPAAERTFQIERDITLEFTDKDGSGNLITGVPMLSWGSTDVGGIYTEQITGLHRDMIKIEGTFLLHKVSSVDELIY